MTGTQHRLRASAILLLVACSGASLAHGQCNSNFTLGPDVTLCTGENVQLNAGAGFESYLWDNGSTMQTRSITTAGTYNCTVTDFGTSGDLVTNGDFSGGATGFTSDYIVGPGGPWGPLSDPGTYGVSNNAQNLHGNFSPCTDHTGGGNMMVVNGAQTAGQNIWCQTVNVQANTNYAFSAWLATMFSESPAELEFTVNGVAVGSGLNAAMQTCNWLNFYGVWPSGPATVATICISNLNTSQSGNDFALDDISFAPFCTYTDEVVVSVQADPQPDLGPDIDGCAGDGFVLDGTVPGADSYLWQDGSNAPTFTPAGSGTYWVEVDINGCTGRDTVVLDILPQPVVDLGPGQTRCAGERTVLDAFNPGATYLWQDGSTASAFEVTTAGNYSVTVTLGICTASDNVTFIYHPLPVVELGADTTLCADTSLTLDVFRAGGSYLWQDGSTLAELTTTTAGTYWVRVTENACSFTDSMALGVIDLPVVDLGPDLLLCIGTVEYLDAQGPDYSYEWNDGSNGPRYAVTGPGSYNVTVGNTCGMASDTINVAQDYCDCPVFAPNAFSPNGDGINEGFLPYFDCPATDYILRVYDRWGSVVWETDLPGKAWMSEENDPNGVYVWTLEMRPQAVGTNGMRRLRGHVTLLR